MSGFRVTLTVGKAELGNLLDQLTAKQMKAMEIAPAKNGRSPAPAGAPPAGERWTAGKVPPRAIVMLSDKTTLPLKKAGRVVVETLEAMEAKQGIGSITYRSLLDACKKKKVAGQTVGSMVRNGYIVPIIGD